MKICLLTQDEHSALGAKLSGIETFLSIKGDVKSLEENWKKAISDPSIAILMLSPGVYESLSEEVESHKRLAKKPYIVNLPEYGSFYENS